MSLTPAQTNERATAFISYAREDEEFVLRLCESLRAHGVEPVGDWLLTAGQRYEGRLRELNLRAQVFVFVITPDSIRSKACRDELTLAVENRKQVLPVSRRDHVDDNLLDSALRAPQWTFLREGNDYEAGVRELVKAVNTDFDLMETHGQLLLAAENWKDSSRNKSYLLRKDGLKEAEVWLARTRAQPAKLPQPTSLQAEFILAGQRSRSRGVRIAFGVVTAVVVSLAALSVVALAQRSLAVRNAAEAQEQARIARENEEKALGNEREARRQKEIADANAREADEQRQKAVDNLAEAQRQQALAKANERKAIRNAEEARRQQLAAEANAARALEQGKRRLMVATLMLNPEGTNFTTLSSLSNFDLMFGIRPWALRDGSLKTLLQKFYAREPALFVRVFGDGDAALAQRLLEHVEKPATMAAAPLKKRTLFLWKGSPPVKTGGKGQEEDEPAEGEQGEAAGAEQKEKGETKDETAAAGQKREGEDKGDDEESPAEGATTLSDVEAQPNFPDGYLNQEPWVTRFKRASQEPAFQAIQLEEHTSQYLSFMRELRRFAPQVKTERGVAFMLDLAFHTGTQTPQKLVQLALKEAPHQSEAELLRRVAELSVQRQHRPVLAKAFRRRRLMFLTTPFFSDRVLGF